MPAVADDIVTPVSDLDDEFKRFRLGNPGTPVKKPLEKTRSAEERTAKKRSEYLKWEEYFMMSAYVASKRSKDPSCQVGCVIVNKNNVIVGTGYNVGCSDDDFPWGKGNENPLDNKYAYVVHAEANAILNKIGDNLEGSTLYTTTFPCNECAKLIIQSRVGSIVYLNDRSEDSYVASKRMFDCVDIQYRQFVMDKDEIMRRQIASLFAVWLASTLLLYFVYSCAPELESKESFSFPKDLDDLKRIAAVLIKYRDQRFSYTLLLFSLALIYKQTFAIPGSFFMNLLGGALFGTWIGLPLVCFLTACGASFCYLLSFFFATSLVNRYYHSQLEIFRTEILPKCQGSFFGLLSARVFPFTPHWLLNIISPFFGVSLPMHFLSVGLGLIPYNFFCIRAGCLLSEITSASDVIDVYTLTELLLMAIVLFAVRRHFPKIQFGRTRTNDPSPAEIRP